MFKCRREGGGILSLSNRKPSCYLVSTDCCSADGQGVKGKAGIRTQDQLILDLTQPLDKSPSLQRPSLPHPYHHSVVNAPVQLCYPLAQPGLPSDPALV